MTDKQRASEPVGQSWICEANREGDAERICQDITEDCADAPSGVTKINGAEDCRKQSKRPSTRSSASQRGATNMSTHILLAS